MFVGGGRDLTLKAGPSFLNSSVGFGLDSICGDEMLLTLKQTIENSRALRRSGEWKL